MRSLPGAFRAGDQGHTGRGQGPLDDELDPVRPRLWSRARP